MKPHELPPLYDPAEALFQDVPAVFKEKRKSPVEFFNNMLHGGVSSVFSQEFF
jgi:hypothetical protein